MTYKILDLFCGAGGAGRGYRAAGFEVTGVDLHPQKNYPFNFIQADALAYLRDHGHEYDAVHCSPPCQSYSHAGRLTSYYVKDRHPALIAPVRELLEALGKPYVIENVAGAASELRNPVRLVGRMFGLKVAMRARLFETNFPLPAPPIYGRGLPIPPAGRGKNTDGEFSLTSGGITGVSRQQRHAGMGYDVPIMTNAELNQSIPPAFTEWIGRALMAYLDDRP